MASYSEAYALVIGVGADLPVTIKDATAIAGFLTDEKRGGIPEKNVRLLPEKKATTDGIQLTSIKADTNSFRVEQFTISKHRFT